MPTPFTITSRALPLFLVSLALALGLPSAVPGYFDGLPWVGHAETLTLAVLLPSLLLLHGAFLRGRWVAGFLLAIVALKTVLWLALPPAGLGLRVYDSPQSLADGRWQRTYASLWDEGVSAVLDAPLRDRRAFPVEWMNRLYERSVPEPPRYWAALEFGGSVRMPADAHIVALADGVSCDELYTVDDNGTARAVPVVGAAPAATVAAVAGPERTVSLHGHLCFGDAPKWSLDLLVVDASGAARSALAYGTAWRTGAGAKLGSAAVALARAGQVAADLGVGGLLLLWCAAALRTLWRSRVLGPAEATVAVAGTLLALSLPRFGFDPTGRVQLAVALGLTGLFWLAWVWVGPGRAAALSELPRRLLVVAGAPLLAFFARLWWDDIGRVSWMTSYDDWTMYQIFAREIFVEGDVWGAQNHPVWVYQPLYRYLVGALHALFGASVVAQRFVDVWAVVAAAAVSAVYARHWTGSGRFALLAAYLYLGCELGWQFTAHIGLGMTEHTALLFLMLSAWAVPRSGSPRAGAVLWAGLLGAVCVLVRMDFLPAVLALALVPLVLQPDGAPTWQLWLQWLREALARWRWLAAFWGIVLAAVLAVALRNWVVGDQFLLTPSQSRTVHTLERSLTFLAVLLNAHKPAQVGLPALILWPAAVAGIAALFWRRGLLARFPVQLGLIMLALVVPYLIYNPLDYVPRKSINVLPWAAVSVSVLAWSVWRSLRRESPT